MLYSFNGAKDGGNPYALLAKAGALYTVTDGAATTAGTVVRLSGAGFAE